MKTFRQLVEAPGSPARDNKREMDDEQEVKGYKPRSKGEEDFANAHNVTKLPHPVATDAQFTGEIQKGNPDHHVGGKKQAPGEAATKQGSSDVKAAGREYKEPKQYARGGEKTPVMQGSSKIKESFASWLESTENGDN